MGGGSSSETSTIPKISADVIRHNRAIFGNKKKDYRDLLKKDAAIQHMYRSLFANKVADGISGSSHPISQPNGEGGNGGAIDYDEEFYKRFDDPTMVKQIVFSNETYDKDSLADKVDEDDMKATSDSFPIKLYIAEPPEEVKEAAPNLDGKVKLAIHNGLVGIFGLAHAALQIGDKMVHFLDNHFVKVDKFKASQALLLINVSKSGRLPKTNQVKDVIADVIVEWNKKALYDKALRNCQDFVEDMCTQINEKCELTPDQKLKLSFNNKILQEYLDTLVKHPEKTGFHIMFQNELKEFESHSELDEWEDENKDKLSTEQMEFLKGFHRAFQLRYQATQLSENPSYSFLKRYEPNPYAGCTRGNATLL